MVARQPGVNRRRAAAHMLVSAFAFSLMSVSVKVASRELPSTTIVFFRNAVALVLLLPWLARVGGSGLRTSHFSGHVVRGLAGLAGMVCFFFAIARMRLADAVLLNYSFPLFMPLAERVWLGTRNPAGTWRRLAIGFCGVVAILKPGSGLFTGVALVGLASGIFVAIAQVGIRSLTRTEPISRIVLYFAIIATLVSALPLPWGWQTPSPSGWIVLGAIGLFATIGQFNLTQAYYFAPATLVAPLIYFTVVFSVLLDWVVWGIWPDVSFAVGAALVVVAGASLLKDLDPQTAGEATASGTG